jgi:hypothetical protein
MCGAILNPSRPSVTSPVTHPLVGEVVPFFPQSGERVVPLTKVSNDELTRVKSQSYSNILDFSECMPIEEPLKFTVDEAIIRATERDTFQARGLLRLKEEYELYGPEADPYIQLVKDKHLELMFVRSGEGPYADFLNTNKIRISLADIESMSLKYRLSKSRLIIRFKFEPPIPELKVDPIDRALALHVVWKDIKLAKWYLAAIKMHLSNAELKKLLN